MEDQVICFVYQNGCRPYNLPEIEVSNEAHMLSTTPPQSKSIDQEQQALPQWLQIVISANGAKGPDMVQSKY
jgi:hypothetical protein